MSDFVEMFVTLSKYTTVDEACTLWVVRPVSAGDSQSVESNIQLSSNVHKRQKEKTSKSSDTILQEESYWATVWFACAWMRFCFESCTNFHAPWSWLENLDAIHGESRLDLGKILVTSAYYNTWLASRIHYRCILQALMPFLLNFFLVVWLKGQPTTLLMASSMQLSILHSHP